MYVFNIGTWMTLLWQTGKRCMTDLKRGGMVQITLIMLQNKYLIDSSRDMMDLIRGDTEQLNLIMLQTNYQINQTITS